MNGDPILFYDRRGVLVTPRAHSVIKPRTGAWIVAKSKDSLLLLWPSFAVGVPDLPGGGVDEGETLLQGAQREWGEETGLPFAPVSDVLAEHHHVRGFYAEDQGEFWIYDQTFFLYAFDREQEIRERWINPEGDDVAWVPFTEVSAAQINRAHWLAVQALVPEVE